ncbi:MAG: DUF3592 domain-containing protein [Deinococcota bacterium]
MGVLLFIVGLAAAGASGYVLVNTLLMRQWVKVTADVLMCEIATKTRRDLWGVATYYYPEVSYRYQLQGKRYTSSRYQFLPLAVSESDALEQLHDYRDLKQLEVYYNPRNKRSAVIKRDLDKPTLIYIAVFGGIGLILMVLAFV